MGILQARILEWVAMPPPGDLLNPGIKARSLTLQTDSLPSTLPGKPIRVSAGKTTLEERSNRKCAVEPAVMSLT